MKECFFCHKRYGLHKHHIYGGPNRKISEKIGACVYLCPEHHNMSNNSVHMNRNMDLKLKRMYQKKYEEMHSREEFILLIGKSFL